MTRRSVLRGSIVALVTPFNADGSLDEKALKDLIEWHITQGTDGIVPCGTTGESATLSHAEHERVVELVVETVARRVPVVAGAGSNATAEAIRLTRHAAKVGADYALSITPYYNKPTQEGLIEHFTAVAEEGGIPLVLYNVPGRTGVNMLPATVAKCAAHPMIAGIKEATADLRQISEIIAASPGDFVLLSGDDFTILPILAVGGRGVISVTANVAPKMNAAMIRAFENGEMARARELHYRLLPLAAALFVESNPIPVKAAVFLLGRCQNVVRRPLTRATPETIKRLESVITALKA